MAGTQVVDQIQLGNNGTAANNFVIKTMNDGTMKIQRGNIGGSLTDVLTIDAAGKPIFAWEIGAGQLSLASNGYVKQANGLILQWGFQSGTVGTTEASFTLPIAFPTGFLNCQAVQISPNGSSAAARPNGLTGIYLRSSSAADSVYWLAIGY